MCRKLERASEVERAVKYDRRIQNRHGESMLVDVYDVLQAFAVQDQAVGHAVKKLLCAGLRAKGHRLQDLEEVVQAVGRAIDAEVVRLAAERRAAEGKKPGAETNSKPAEDEIVPF